MNATHVVDVEEIQTTRGEKALAAVLAIFLLIGLVWGYTKLDLRDEYAAPPPLTAQEQTAVDRLQLAEGEAFGAEEAERAALADLELKRERYRTELDAGREAPALAAEYRRAERAYEGAQQRLADAKAEVAATRPAAEAISDRRFAGLEAERRRDERNTFLLRLAFALVVLGAAYGLLHALRGSRYFTLGLAAVGAAAILALVLTGDYVENRVEWGHTGPFALSIGGILLTMGAFWGLQRYLQRRIPLRRVRKGECPFCGFPGSGNPSCEGCGRTIAGSCSHCGERRRVGVLFCGSCGGA